MSDAPEAPPPEFRRRARTRDDAVPLGLLLVAATCMLWWNYGIWADPIVDFGRELYVPGA